MKLLLICACNACLCAGFMQRPDDFTNTLFVARITDWTESMQMPKGLVVFVVDVSYYMPVSAIL